MSFGPERIGFEPPMPRAIETVVFSAVNFSQTTGSMELSRSHKGRQGEKKDSNGSMPYRQGGSTRRESGSKTGQKRPNGGSSNNGNGGPRPH